MFRVLTQVVLEFLVWRSVERFFSAYQKKSGLDDSVYKKKNRFDDPVYKANLERLIEHHRQFEKKE
jgi:hypothetical protein